ncbi:MAG TPA: tetratricopeptide repeat protein [Candidatus Ozemobacteraceae bacterium]|nr:tetratricopeptide repeat protein [Candidatus Ozemobacteraceae bacterium]
MIPGEEKGEISNEFFKKLNQQIVQKDNLIKLLQLQIKTLKSQADETGAGPRKADLEKALEAKEAEVKKLESGLAEQKAELDARLREKEEQIQSLQQMLEQHQQNSQEALAAPAPDPRVPELESRIVELQNQLEIEKQARAAAEAGAGAAGQAVEEEANKLRADLEIAQAAAIEAETLRSSVKRLEGDLQLRDSELARRDSQLVELKETLQKASDAPASTDQTRLAELEQDVATLRSLLAEKDEQIAAAATGGAETTELKTLRTELATLQKQLQELLPRAGRADELEKLNAELATQVSELPGLRQKVAHLERESTGLTEMSLKLTALESERQAIQEELSALKARPMTSAEDLDKLRKLNDELGRRLTQRDEEKTKLQNEVAELRVALDTRRDQSIQDPKVQAELEQLTNQVADQLVAIQKLEALLNQQKRELTAKDEEVAVLRQKAALADDQAPIIPADADNEIISGFIDFFDGLDAFLVKNQIPELQTLHRKLLERLILPNKIQYMPVISEEFDEQKHIATDFFRSDKFPEKCIVFEVEKGYRKGEAVIKKSKVWVVQNLYNCAGCNTLQSNPDSRFCHLCGKKITAPNDLPVDSLPVFEPTATTYLRFAERMIDSEQYDKAREYLRSGLALDPESVPLLVRLGDVYAQASEFAESLRLLRQAQALKPDPRVDERIKQLEVKNTIFQQARSLNLAPEEFSKLVNLIQK